MIVLDTHAFLWLASSPERLSPAALAAISADGEPALATISLQEIAYLLARGRLEFDRPAPAWLRDALSQLGVRPLPLSASIAIAAGGLDPDAFHGDPADRIIYATARQHACPLVTRDARISSFDPATALW